MCQFEIAWVGKCQDSKERYCDIHLLRKCLVCNRQATHTCPETNGLVCGASLCDNCEHQLNSEGVNDGFKHCSKSEQPYLNWIEQGFCRDNNISQEDWTQMSEQQKLDAIRTPPKVKPPKEIWEYARQVCDKLGVNGVWCMTYFQTVHDCWFSQLGIEECCNQLVTKHSKPDKTGYIVRPDEVSTVRISEDGYVWVKCKLWNFVDRFWQMDYILDDIYKNTVTGSIFEGDDVYGRYHIDAIHDGYIKAKVNSFNVEQGTMTVSLPDGKVIRVSNSILKTYKIAENL